jgi:hypothetical protein
MFTSATFRIGEQTSRFLNIGIIAASFGIFVSLSDFVLSVEQKKKIDSVIDGLTLRLDYTKTFDWLQRWLKASRRASIADAVFAGISVLLTLIVLITVEWSLWSTSSWWELIGAGFVAMVLWLWQWSYIDKAYDKVGGPIINWLAERESYASLIAGYVAVIVGGIVVLTLCIVLVLVAPFLLTWLLNEALGDRWNWVTPAVVIFKIPTTLAWSFVFGLGLCWIGITIDGVATMIGAFIIFVARLVVNAARWTMWKVSSYPKGPLTATLTLIGAGLALAKMLAAK